MTAATEVLISLGGSQYIVKVDPSIPPGEIRIGRFAALDALAEASSQPLAVLTQPPTPPPVVNGTASTAPDPAPAPVVYTPKHYKMTRLRGKEVTQIREWLVKRVGTLSKLEQTVMLHSFPPNKKGYVNSNIVAAQTGVEPDAVRNVRNSVMRKAGAMHRNA
jgi:hypothetical protein